MELNLSKIKQLDEQQILDILLPTINSLYKKVDYIGMTKNDFYNLALEEIYKSKKSYIGDIDYIKYIKNKINIALADQVKKDLIEPETAIIIINNYINKHLKKSFSYEDSIENLKKINTFFETYNYIPNPDVVIQIIKENSIFSKMIESIMKKHQTQILSGNLEKIFDDITFTLIIETYCMLNNIEIEESEEFEKYSIDSKNYELTDSVKAYLKEIDRRPLLSPEEERKLAKRISQGDSYAREIFIESNLKLVVSIAKRYIDRGLSFLDLIQEGNLGLMTAVDKFDVSRDYKFSTYATWWIRQAILRAIANKGRNVRISVNMYEKITSYKKAITNLEVRLNRQPTINEIANEMGLSIPEVTKLHKLQSDTVSMNTLIGDNEDTELESFIPASEETPEDLLIENDMKLQVRKLLENCNLKPREIEILMLRFGFDDGKPMTLEEVGKKFNISRERTRQIESKALMKIRRSRYIKEFAVYMQNPTKSLENIEFFREKYRETGNSNKTFLKENRLTQKKEKKEMAKLQTIYEYFSSYTKEQVDAMLEKLTEEERMLITLRYGEDLNNPTPIKLSKEQTNKFYGVLIPKMK
ncbi:MAG: sigma-70 family RNA polymerase sigma factor, partial [bacterium]|nr:sigma-70 family RNA polymerase sigma factor [bacterium]